jgi:hypothetical protein
VDREVFDRRQINPFDPPVMQRDIPRATASARLSLVLMAKCRKSSASRTKGG